MELRQLEQFVAVAEEGHFARAAARCTVVPSALSTSVRVLEGELGTPLLRRTTRSVALTDAGHLFLVEARKCLDAAASARAAVTGVRQLLAGTLRVGGIPTDGLFDQPALLRRLSGEHPAVNVGYVRGASGPMTEEVRAGRLDVAVIALLGPPPTDLTVIEVAHGPVLLACHEDHRLARRSTVGATELVRERFVAMPAGSCGRGYVEQIFAAAGTAPNVPYEVNDVPTMLDFIEQGLGVGLVVESLAAGRPRLRTLVIEDPALTWAVAVIAPPAGRITPATQAFLDLVIS